MPFDVAILLAALGITTLEFSEAAAVGLALYAESRSHMAFFYVAMGSLVVLIPTVFAGAAIGYLPRQYVLLVGGVLLAYFGNAL
jgi:uncharacterized membrane protein